MTPYNTSETALIILFFLCIALALIFLITGINNWKEHDRFEKIAFLATIIALFMAQLTSIASNINIMEHVKSGIESIILDPDESERNDESITDENVIDEHQVQEPLSQDQLDKLNDLEKFVAENPNIIFKDDIFLVEIRVRNVTADEDNGNASKNWEKSVDAKIGDEIEYQIHYKNTGTRTSEDVIVEASLPNNMEYVSGSTKLYNTNHPEGATVNSDSLITDHGINIGSYYVNGDAYVRFRTKVTDRDLVTGTNRLIMWSKITNRYKTEDGEDQRPEALLDSADMYVEKTED